MISALEMSVFAYFVKFTEQFTAKVVIIFMLADAATVWNNVCVIPHLCMAPQLALELLLPHGYVGAGGGGGTSSPLRLILGQVHSSTFAPGSLQVYEITASRGPFFLVNSQCFRCNSRVRTRQLPPNPDVQGRKKKTQEMRTFEKTPWLLNCEQSLFSI